MPKLYSSKIDKNLQLDKSLQLENNWFGHKNKKVTLTWINGKDFCKKYKQELSVYVKSLKNISNCDHVVISADISISFCDFLIENGVHILHPDAILCYDANIHNVTISNFIIDRHKVFRAFVNRWHYYLYIITDAKDIIFQKDIENDINSVAYTELLLVSEGMKYNQSEWNRKDMENWMPSWKDDNYDVINGGIQIGTHVGLLDFYKIFYETAEKYPSLKTYTDQAIINFLYHSGQLSFATVDNKLCLTGEAAKNNFTDYKLRDGRFYDKRNELFTLVHQWERLPCRDEIIHYYL